MFNYKTVDGAVRAGKVVSHIVIALFVVITIFGGFGTVRQNEVGVRTRFSKVVGMVQAGLYFKVPFIEQVNKIGVNTRTVNYDKNGKEGDSKDSSTLAGASKDLQDVQIGVVVQYHVKPVDAEKVFIQFRSVDNFETTVIESIIRKTVKALSAQYTAEELVTKRVEYNDRVNKELTTLFGENFAVLELSNITNFQFSPIFTEAIEAKVTAVQKAEAAKNKLEQIKFEAAQTVTTAQAQAEAIKIQAQAINSQGGADYVQLQAVAKWDGKLPTQMIPNASVPFLNLK